MNDLWQRLKQRKLVQWALAYVAAAFALLQGIDIVAQPFGWPESIERILIIAICVGFFVTLLLAWYHGEQGRQRASGTELLLIALVIVLAVSGGLLWKFAGTSASHDATANSAMPATQATPKVASAADNVRPSPAATTISAKSIAVLPFVNMSGDPKNDYFSDGITEEILHALTQVPDLSVAGRTSAFAFKGKAEDFRKVGEALGVATVLEGSVQKSGDEVRITAQLIDTRSGYLLWSEKYDRRLTSIFVVEDEISKAITDKLQVQLADGGLTLKPIDPRAHDLYLRGLTLLAARGPGLRNAVAAFIRAIGIAPGYAQAWGAMAQAEALYSSYGLGSFKESNSRALASAQRALALNPNNASALVAQGMAYGSQWQWSKADAALARALALAPGDAETVSQYAQFLGATGNFDQALVEIKRAQKLDPLAPVNSVVRAETLYLSHRSDEAWVEIRRAAAAFPDFAKAQSNAVIIALATHHWADAERSVRKVGALAGLSAGEIAQFIYLIHGMADPALHASAAQRMKIAPLWLKFRGDAPTTYAALLCMLDDCKSALPVLEQWAAKGGSTDAKSIWDPAFDPLRDDPRFKEVLKKMGLPYAPAKAATP